MFLVEVAFFQQIPLPIDQKSADAKNTLLTFISDKTNLLHPMLSKQDTQFQIKGQQTKCTFDAISGWNATLHSRVGRLFSCSAFLLYYVVSRSSQRWRQTCTQSISHDFIPEAFKNSNSRSPVLGFSDLQARVFNKKSYLYQEHI